MKTIVACICILASLNCAAAGIPVLTYHQITNDAPAGETVISSKLFEQEMQYLHEAGYQTISSEELVDVMNKKMPLPDKAVVITFDDGWVSVLNGVPVLDSYHMKASFNIISGTLTGKYGPDYLSATQIKYLTSNKNFEIESHSVTHPWKDHNNLVSWDEGKTEGRGTSDVHREIVDSKATLDALGEHVKLIAWPSGWYNQHLLELAKQAGYEGAMMAWGEGGNSPGDDPFQIKRINISGVCNIAQFKQIVEHSNSVPCK